MWSSVYLDYSAHRNFNVGFASHKNDVHIQLSQWQYWWWFWFALVWAVYFLVILRVYLTKTENLNINLNTSLRSHGKWGDFLVALIPLSWCGNILINSNFILRMLEWQNESSLFVVRIQGKQWYWVYKYNSDTNFRLNNIYINVGNDNWLKLYNKSVKTTQFNKSLMLYNYEFEFKKLHSNILKKYDKQENTLKNIFLNKSYSFYKNNFTTIENINIHYKYNLFNNIKNYINYSNYSTPFLLINSNFNLFDTDVTNKDIFYKKNNTTKSNKSNNLFFLHNNKNISNFENDRINDIDETLENLRYKTTNFPIKLIKGILNNTNINNIRSTDLLKNTIFQYKINNNDIEQKISQIEQFWGFRQKRYKKLRAFTFIQNTKYNSNTYQKIQNFTKNNNFDKYQLYNSVKNNKYKTELISVSLGRRLLRTKRTLVLPAHINITLITSSYDVVHSWFVPGLGLKIDCVPGRSTHHTL